LDERRSDQASGKKKAVSVAIVRGMAGGRMTASVSQHQRLGSFCFVSVSVRNLYFNLPRQIHDLFTGLPPGDFSLISPATRIPVQAPSSLK
jgi:hypothetical protein